MISNSVQASSHRLLTGNLLINIIRYQLDFSRRNIGNLVYRIRIIVSYFKKMANAFPLILILLSTCTLLLSVPRSEFSRRVERFHVDCPKPKNFNVLSQKARLIFKLIVLQSPSPLTTTIGRRILYSHQSAPGDCVNYFTIRNYFLGKEVLLKMEPPHNSFY